MTGGSSPDGRVRVEVSGLVATVRIDRPEKLNAVAPEMLEALRQSFDRLDKSSNVRAILLTASGERAFSVGADINAWSALDPLDMWRRWVRDGHVAIDAIASVRQPVICVIGGLALGGGLEIALACDVRICSESARFGSPEVKIGTLPGWGGTRRLRETIGSARAKQMIFTGEQIDAPTALNWGLVNEVVPADGLMARAVEIAETIAGNAPIATQLAKAVIDSDRGSEASMEAIAGALAASTEDGREGIASFREKRPAEFSDN